MTWEGLTPPYSTIVADPPWRYASAATKADARKHYTTTSTDVVRPSASPRVGPLGSRIRGGGVSDHDFRPAFERLGRPDPVDLGGSMTRTTLVTIAVTGPHPVVDRFANGHDDRYWWEVDGPGGRTEGHAPTEGEAWAAARAAAVGVLGRLEVPGGGAQLAGALQGPRVVP